jgi:hypothetical protein
MEETFLHAWDELDDLLCLCRHVATVTAGEALGGSLSMLASVCGVFLTGAATAVLAVRQLFDPAA